MLDSGLEKKDEKIASTDIPYDTSYAGLTKDEIPNIITEFKTWLGSDAARKHLETIEREKQDVKNLMNKLNSMDKDSAEFIDEVLYGLLPYSKTKHAKRVSTFPVFFNVKQFFKNYRYEDADWKKIANMIYSLASKLQQYPDRLDQWIKDLEGDDE
jgi:hypothetical protein